MLSFFSRGRGLFDRSSRCKKCARIENTKWYAAQWRRSKNMTLYYQAKEAFLITTGGDAIAVGKTEPTFLTLDHVNNDGGGRFRKTVGYVLYRGIINADFPDSFQILCWNCNTGKQKNGGVCPHRARIKAVA